MDLDLSINNGVEGHGSVLHPELRLNQYSMLESQLSASCKHQRPETPEPKSQPISKKQRRSHLSGPQPPTALWDNLSKTWLTKGALSELDRRNTQAAQNQSRSLRRRVRQLVTQKLCADRNRQTAQYNLKDIKLFARRGGPDLSELRNYPQFTCDPVYTMSSSPSTFQGRKKGSVSASSTKPTTDSTNTKTTGTYSRNFQQHLVDNNIYPPGYTYVDGHLPAKPNNWKDIKIILSQPRPSLSPSRFNDEDYETFVQADTDAFKEKQVSESVIPIIEGKITDFKCRSGEIPFTNLDSLTHNTLKPGNPDIYYGARPEQLSRKVRDDLSGRIVPSTQDNLPMVPNFFVAAKGPDGSLAVASRQACYDGALGARGMHSLQSYQKDEPVFDNDAHTITTIYHGGTLKMYTSHIAPQSDHGARPEYHMTQLRSFAMTDTPDTCRDGMKAFRNGRDWAKMQRDEAIKCANERANSIEDEISSNNKSEVSPTTSFVSAVSDVEAYIMSQESRTSLNDSNAQGLYPESDNSTEELTAYIHPAKRFNKAPKRPQTPRKRRNAGESSGGG